MINLYKIMGGGRFFEAERTTVSRERGDRWIRQGELRSNQRESLCYIRQRDQLL